ncbi:hypothetical protein KI387_039911 [Taxus chinensis]|uniref:Uncharacterized protein n=1 Tax=Taxus chinensis TaxID=29808 RepID=A0AA38CCJ5_TAXCH|nr:hypothetical protein KI387_039911 [Taxus chinensis]
MMLRKSLIILIAFLIIIPFVKGTNVQTRWPITTSIVMIISYGVKLIYYPWILMSPSVEIEGTKFYNVGMSENGGGDNLLNILPSKILANAKEGLLLNFCSNQKKLGLVNMGGDRIRVEPTSHSIDVCNQPLWNRLRIGGFNNFIAKLHGHDPSLSKDFRKAWKVDKFVVRGMEIEVFESSITQVTDMKMDGLKIFKDRTRRE